MRIQLLIVLMLIKCSSPVKEQDIFHDEVQAEDLLTDEQLLEETVKDILELVEEALEVVEDTTVEDTKADEVELEKVQWKQLGVPFPEDFVFKGIHGFDEGSLFIVGAGAVAYLFNGYEFENLGAPHLAEMLNAVWGTSPSSVWMGGIKGVLLRYDGFGWTGAGFCKEKGDCIQTDECLEVDCVNGACIYTPSQTEGCCGFPMFDKDFDDGTLQGFKVSDIYGNVPGSGGIVWNVISHIDPLTNTPRYTSPPYALYFGIPDKPCYFDPSKKCPDFNNGKTVGSTAVSKAFKLPHGEKALLKFNVFIDAEQPNSYDLLKISVISGGVEKDVWDKSKVGGITNKQFVPAEADISEFLGKEIRVSLLFDSIDQIANQFEGVFIDDMVIETTCPASSPVKYETIYDIFGTADNNIYAVGRLGQILHYDGSGWKKLPLNESVLFHGMCASEDGIFFTATEGRIFIYKDKEFEEVNAPVKEDIYGCSLGKLFVGGGGTLLKYENGSFNIINSPVASAVKSVTTGDGSTFWAVGESGLLLKINDGVEKFPVIGNGVKMHSIWARGAKDIFASGDSGVIVRYTGNFWITQKTPLNQPLLAVHGNSSGETYAVGRNGTVIRLEGNQWIQETAPVSVDLTGVFVLEDGLVYASGLGGMIIVRKDGVWKEAKSPTSNDLMFLSGKGNQLFTGGLNVISVFDGVVWRNIFSRNMNDLRGIFALAPDNVVAVGDNGVIMRYNGFTWYQEEVPPLELESGEKMKFTKELYAVWGNEKNNLLAVGAEGSVVRFDGSAWNLESAGTKKTLRSISGIKEDRIWASGVEGAIIHFNGKEWKKENSGSIATLYDIFALNEKAIYTVGDRGTVLKRE